MQKLMGEGLLWYLSMALCLWVKGCCGTSLKHVVCFDDNSMLEALCG